MTTTATRTSPKKKFNGKTMAFLWSSSAKEEQDELTKFCIAGVSQLIKLTAIFFVSVWN